MSGEFESYLDHVAGVLLQTLSIEKSTLPDGAVEEVKIEQPLPPGRPVIWTIKFMKQKGTWKLSEISHGKK